MGTQTNPFAIGITGAFGSGKTSASSFFEKKGFKRIRLSLFLEEELNKRHKKITRKNLQDLGNEFREKEGPNFLAKKALFFAEKNELNRFIIDGIRNVSEISYLRKKSNFVLLGIIADRKIRFERLKYLKNRESLTEELFEKLDARDLGINEKETGLQVAKCFALSDNFILNNGTQKEFEEKLAEFLKNI